MTEILENYCEHPFQSTVRMVPIHFDDPNMTGAQQVVAGDRFCRDCGEPLVVQVGTEHHDESPSEGCRVYWGSHGCALARGHAGHHECECCTCGENHPYPDWPDRDVVCVAKFPYYDRGLKDGVTTFYGEDATEANERHNPEGI